MWNDYFTRDVTHPHVTQLIDMCHVSFICDTTHSYVTRLVHTWHDSVTCETWLSHMWDMTQSQRHDSVTCETWLSHMWDMTQSHVRHDSVTCEKWLSRTQSHMTWLCPKLHAWHVCRKDAKGTVWEAFSAYVRVAKKNSFAAWLKS